MRIKKLFFAFPKGIGTGVALVALVSLSACGGGDSSSGSDAEINFAGTYQGGGDTDFTTGNETVNIYTPAKIIVRSNNRVEASDGTANIKTSGNLTGEKFETTGIFINQNNGLDCNMATRYTGSIKLDNGIATATGNLTGNGECNGEPSSFTGVYTARKVSGVAK